MATSTRAIRLRNGAELAGLRRSLLSLSGVQVARARTACVGFGRALFPGGRNGRLLTLTEHGAKLDVLATRMDGLKSEMRLMWGALGALVTVLGLVFTLLFSR